MKMRLTTLLLFVTALSCAQNPTLWGLTQLGGANQAGTIFKYDIEANTITNMHDFGSDSDGANPTGSLIRINNGLLYGVTQSGSINGQGCIFSFNILTGKDSVLHSFGIPNDGTEPNGPLLAVGDTILYGTTQYGGQFGFGTIFCYNLVTGTYQILHSFSADSINNTSQPMGPLLQASNGLLYGLNKYNGAYSSGGVFSYNPATGTEADVCNFSDTCGEQPEGGLIEVNNGLLFGTSIFGGAHRIGTLFSYNINTGKDSAWLSFSFNNGQPETSSNSSLLPASDGSLYGLTSTGGLNGFGVLFRFDPATGLYLVQHAFGAGNDAQSPVGSLIQASNGLLYGLAVHNPGINAGTLFSYNISTGIETVLESFGSSMGNSPRHALLEIDLPTSVPSISLPQLQIAPNPSTGQFNIQLPGNKNNYIAEIYNTLGQKIEQLTLTNAVNTINLSNQPTGMYFINVQTEDGVINGMIMVAR